MESGSGPASLLRVTWEGWPEESRRENKVDLATAGLVELYFSCFMGMITLVVAGVDFSLRGPAAALEFVLGFATKVRELETESESRYGFSESEGGIMLRRGGDTVHVTCTYRPGSAEVGFEALRALADGAARGLVAELVGTYPALAENVTLDQRVRKVYGVGLRELVL